MKNPSATVLLLLLAAAAPNAAQEAEIRDARLPRAVEARLLAMYDGGAERVDGPMTIEAGEVRVGHLAVMGGPLRVAGRLEGDAAMVGGDVVLEPGGVVTGSITVIGGEVRMADDAAAEGTISVYGASPAGAVRPRRDRDDGAREPDWRRPAGPRGDNTGFSRLTLRTGPSYNRVEGLPVHFGPIVETAGAAPLRLEAFGIWRTASGAPLDSDRMGYQVRAEQFLGRDRAVGVGASVYSVVAPLDRWQVGDLEASLGTVLFHYDPRDHYDRSGWSAFLRARPLPGVDARVVYRDERHASSPVADPWALFDRADGWRPQPLVAEGSIRSVGGSVELDRRDRRSGPRDGWLVRASAEQAVGGVLVLPGLTAVEFSVPFAPERSVDTDFTTAFVDVRRYNPVGDRSGLNMRAVAGGSVTGGALPPQYQHALGGPGTLPGYPLFHADCGARSLLGRHGEETYFSGYGCDRFALGQVEYRGGLTLGFRAGDGFREGFRDWRHGFDVEARPAWALFANAGRGWAHDRGTDPASVDTGVLVDAGVGVLLGQLGVYAAVPLAGDVDRSPRFFLRWGQRF
jgi:hypothetical protein